MPSNEPVLIPEIVEPDEALPPDLIALRKFAWMLDAAVAIPGTRRRVGVSAAIGFVPGVGDAVGGFLSAWIILGAIRHRVPNRRVLRMILNVAIDVLVGSIPLFGDLADVFFKENLGNIQILIDHRDRRRPPRSAGDMFFAALVVIAIFIVLALAAIIIALLALYWLLRSGF
ncbi:MAG: DUF4112 domain-containing protein [Thermoanaerobaculia bacterium]